MQLGEVFRIFRIANDMSIKDAAKTGVCTAAYLSEVENGNRIPSYEMLKQLASVYHARLSDIVKIYEDSCDGNWEYKKTLLETLKLMVSQGNAD